MKVEHGNLFDCTTSGTPVKVKKKGEKVKVKVRIKQTKVKHENLLGCTISTAGHPRDELNRLDGLVYQIS